MIPKSNKFPLRTDFIRFRKRCKKYNTPHFTLCYEPSTMSSRLSVIIPKKVNKLATARNALKRLTYDTLWSLIKDKQLDCVIVYKPLPIKNSPPVKNQIISELQSISLENWTCLRRQGI